MKNMKITTINKKLIIKTEDSFGEKTFEIVKALCENDYLGNYRSYYYKSKYGDCKICFVNNILTIDRKGIFNNSFEIFFNGIKNKFLYETDMIKEEFYSLGETISFDATKKVFSFSYKLLDLNYSELNRISISIKEI
ncbi:MAG: hypothetical protein Q4A58_06610 [Fusobacterium sp.]|uniref:hypothetical protein n=1 Tax=Fusobacterium sp. TaxID=68766 RepID=UPI0026DD97FB|nr:hypothetical protein [Fusobacterium sp.]MDO4690947.1 hypothetical protein [Fusobacterium sp.]